MAGYFKDEDIQRLCAGQEKMHQQFHDLREQFTVRTYKSDRGREFANHGFSRRLGTMVRAVDIVYEKLPPELEAVPAHDTVVDATIAIHSFVLNAFGCLENLAWIWVCEKPVLKADGSELKPGNVGLGRKNTDVRASLSKEFVDYLESRQVWLDNLRDFRDSLAHRIPLYIPPFNVTPERLDEYNRLEAKWRNACRKHDFKSAEELLAAQKALGFWRPWMRHSFSEKSPGVVFHSQLVADFMTIDECARELLREFERQAL